ncbi:interleukin-6 receptor subunit alpha [Mugil cephalus]|uniref:interleukin-6 receptor subunit alpha n=1 Tax=Mugil cephalus TaxID=48193 RepID=UPI001FB6BC90|nr:interleukin-6 receptor subunit alpha [Mugil cephalus]
MGIFLLLLCVFNVSSVRSIFDGACPRKEPLPGVLVLSPGSTLVLTCSGHVKVDGVKISLNRDNSNTNKRISSPAPTPTAQSIMSSSEGTTSSGNSSMKNNASEGYDSLSTEAGATAVPAKNRSLGFTDTGYTASPHLVQPTSSSRRLKRESDWEYDDMDFEGDYEDVEGEEGNRVTRGIKSRPRWMWNKKTVGKGDRDWGKVTFGRNGAALTLASVRLTDSGKYACHHRGRERFAVKVVVADSPKTPSLFCYKRSPSSKIRCESSPQKTFIKHPSCYLGLNKRVTNSTFEHFACAYSFQHSRCWCALDFNDDDLRTLHVVYLCLTSIGGSATSGVLQFTPLGILKPDPPVNAIVRQEEGQPTKLKVTWSLPLSWKMEDGHYELIYEIKYRPSKSSFDHDQVSGLIIHRRSYTITDVIPGVEYMIKIRTKDEYDGDWSEWSTPVYGSSWRAPVTMIEDMTTTAFEFPDIEDSGSGTPCYSGTEADASEGSHNVHWVSGLFVLFLIIFSVYLFRHKDKFISKLHSHHGITKCGNLPQHPPSTQTPPPAQTAPEEQALVTLAPPLCPEHLPNHEEEDEENEEEQRTGSLHFNNTSYFLVQREG